MYLNKKISGIKIAKKFNVSNAVVYKFLKENKVKTRSNKINSRKYSYDMNYFDKIDTNEKAYWLGFIYTDGYITSRQYNKKLGIALGIKDKGHLQKFKKAIKAENPIKIYDISSGYKEGKYCRFMLSGENIYNQMKKHGVLEHKSDYIEPPTIDEKYKRPFIRGYFDGNGSIPCWDNKHNTNTKNFAFSVTAHKNIIGYIKNFIKQEANINIGKNYDRKEDDQVVSFKVGGNLKTQKALDVLYKNANVYLERKYQRYKELCSQNVELHGNM